MRSGVHRKCAHTANAIARPVFMSDPRFSVKACQTPPHADATITEYGNTFKNSASAATSPARVFSGNLAVARPSNTHRGNRCALITRRANTHHWRARAAQAACWCPRQGSRCLHCAHRVLSIHRNASRSTRFVTCTQCTARTVSDARVR